MGEANHNQTETELAIRQTKVGKLDTDQNQDQQLPDSFFQNPIRIDEPDLASELFQTEVRVVEPQAHEQAKESGLAIRDVTTLAEQQSDIISVDHIDSQEQTRARVEFATDEEIIAKINAILAHPENFKKTDVQDAILDAFAGRNYAQFLAEESTQNPQLVQAVENLKAFMESVMGRNTQNTLRTAEALGLPAPQETLELSAADIEDVSQVEAEDGQQSLVITKKGKRGLEKVTIGFAAAAAMFLVADVAFFKGSNMEAIGQRFGAEGAKYLLLRLGFDVKLTDTLDAKSMEKLIDLMEPHKFQRYIEESNEEETIQLLEHISLETRQAMLSGKEFGGASGNLHKLEDKTITLIFSRLSENDMERLGVTKLNPNAQKKTTTGAVDNQTDST